MKKLHFDYYMQIDYNIEVTRCNFTIKCFPQDNCRQRIENVAVEMFPECVYRYGKDGMNNKQIYGLDETGHTMFFFRITGDALVGICDYEETEDEDKTMIFRHPHGLNKPGDAIKEYFQRIKPDKELSPLEIAEVFMQRLHEDFRYQQFSTNVKTTAEEAFSQGCGVCQDYAHIFISLLHLANVPARYVTGLLRGEGESHAWVEVLQDHRWYGFDPTNNCRVFDNHIKIGIGRDAHDCMINRGIMHGGGLHTQTVKVKVNEIGED